VRSRRLSTARVRENWSWTGCGGQEASGWDPALASLRLRPGVFGIFVLVLLGGPAQVVALEPFADGALHADVVPGVLGAVPLVLEDLVALLEEEGPELGLGDVLWDLRVGGLAVAVLELGQDGDGEL
jgi:hypothetical protein